MVIVEIVIVLCLYPFTFYFRCSKILFWNHYFVLYLVKQKVTPSDVTDLYDQIYLKQGEVLSLIGFSGLEILKEMHAIWNFQLLGE